MSSKTDAYLIPIDPTQPKTVAPGIAIEKLWASARPTDKADEAKLFYLDKDAPPADLVSVVSLGPKIGKAKENAKNEALRRASGLAARALKDAGAKSVAVDASNGAHATAVGTYLGLHKFTLKTKKDPNPDIEFKPLENSLSESNGLGWETGVQYAKAQILARELMEFPANFITPTTFCERVQKEFEGVANVTIHVRDEAWAEEQGMRTFLSVTHGTSEPAKFLELHYHGAASKDEQPLVFVGKGITFDSGGISIKPSADMKAMRADMGGAATVVSAALAIAKLRLPVNLVVLTPLTENLPGPAATKPGDIVYAMNGKTVEVDNTDAEGRLVLSDALTYGSRNFNAHTVIDVATLTGAMGIALGDLYSGVFSTSDSLWQELHTAGEAEYDRFWRMPLDEDYGPQIYSSNADLCNTGGRPAGSCTAALFLKSFVEGIEPEEGAEQARIRWAHIDIAGTMEQARPNPYQHKGMTGRPVRALVEFVRRSSQK